MEIYDKKQKSVLNLAYHLAGRIQDVLNVALRPPSARKGGARDSRQAEEARRCHKAQALANAWQGVRYFR